MRPKIYIPILFLTLVLLTILLRLHSRQHPAILQALKPVQATDKVENSNYEKTNLPASNPPIKPRVQGMVTSIQNDPQKLYEKLREFVGRESKPIEFYGKVIDQDSNALAGAKIRIGVSWWTVNPITLNTVLQGTNLERISDLNGRFEFHGVTGDGFGVGITKDGYELEQNKFSSGPTAGSYENPVIFKMWSTNIHEQLITGNKSFDIVPDGRVYFIDLTTDTINESGEGDLKVWIQYTNQVKDNQLHDWSAGIQVINGGLLEEGLGSAMYEAPTDGYVPSFQQSGQIKGYQRGQITDRNFYLLLKNGQEYGQMSINLIAPFNNQTPGLVRLSYAINPSGSRILR
ncbi:MAG: hypothetical protein ACREC8_07100 [Limisphaerales bacterium]